GAGARRQRCVRRTATSPRSRRRGVYFEGGGAQGFAQRRRPLHPQHAHAAGRAPPARQPPAGSHRPPAQHQPPGPRNNWRRAG
nr:hypothetical protein [Tanacetum cinerariifolium]